MPDDPIEQLGDILRAWEANTWGADANGVARFLPKLKAALHKLRVEFFDWQFREFPMAGADAVRCMGIAGLCSQAEADAAMAEARAKWLASLSDEERAPHDPNAVPANADRADSFDDEMPF